jgi:signal peptidase I
MARIADQAPGYEAGYQLVDPRTAGSDPCYLASPNQKVLLGPGEYLALGDNTTNSRDSRYWGPVRQRNLVGPACLVYWPFSKRWGLIE